MLDEFRGCYGQGWTQGILIDRISDALAAGALVHESPRGFLFLTGPRGGSADPVLCGDFVEIWTEDGRMDGRCGLPVKAGDFACPGHQAERNHWRNSSEEERCWLEGDLYR